MTSTQPKPLQILSHIIMVITAIVFCVALIASAYYFTGFLGGGRSWVAILQAFAMCFGLGAMLYVPAAILFFTARHIRKSGPKLSIGIAAICIALPLIFYGVFGQVTNMPYAFITFAVLAYGLLILCWGIYLIWLARRPSP